MVIKWHKNTKIPMKLATVSMCLNTLISSIIQFSSFFSFPSELIYQIQRIGLTGFIRLFVTTNMPLRRVECLGEKVMHDWHFKGYKWITKERTGFSRSRLSLAKSTNFSTIIDPKWCFYWKSLNPTNQPLLTAAWDQLITFPTVVNFFLLLALTTTVNSSSDNNCRSDYYRHTPSVNVHIRLDKLAHKQSAPNSESAT